MSDSDDARFARERLRQLAREHPAIASALGVQGDEVPLGFTIKAYADELDEQIAALKRARPRASGFGGVPTGVPLVNRKSIALSRLETLRSALEPFRHWARTHEEHNPKLRAKVMSVAVELVARELRRSGDIELRFGPLPRLGRGDRWHLTKVNALVKFHVKELFQGVVGGRVRSSYVTRVREEWIDFLYLDWNAQTISTKAPPEEKERDVWYWIGKISEAFLVLVDIVTLTGLLRRAVLALAGRLARRRAAKALLQQSVRGEVNQLYRTAEATVKKLPRSTRSSMALKPPREAVGRSGPYARSSGTPPADRRLTTRHNAGTAPSGHPVRPRSGRPAPDQRRIDDPHGAGRRGPQNPEHDPFLATDRPLHTGGKAGTGRRLAATTRTTQEIEKRTIDDLAHEISEEAATRAVRDPRFLQHLESGRKGIVHAGNRFHVIAKAEAERIVRSGRLPQGYSMDAEITVVAGKGGSRLDLLVKTPTARLFEIDWKTSVKSGLSKSVRSKQMPKHAEAVSSRRGRPLAGQESRSWGQSVVRALRRAGLEDSLSKQQRRALEPWL